MAEHQHNTSTDAPDLKRVNRLLDGINTPADMRGFSDEALKQLAHEVRTEVIDIVSKTGGHLGAGLGVVELTCAIHAVFDTPNDKLIWDVGHQCYPHKVLTGRREQMHTLRQGGGLSGFTKRSESAYDPFGAAHSSTSISAGLGMAVARDLKGDDFNVIAVVGDGAISSGMAFEAMNNAGDMRSRLLVVLNDNDMSIAPPTGALSHYFSKLVSSRQYLHVRDIAKAVTRILPESLQKIAKHAEGSVRESLGQGNLFGDLGFYYIGPVDGHDLDILLPLLRNIRDSRQDRPVLLHVVTQKGKGYPPAEGAADKMHGVSSFDVPTGKQNKPATSTPSFTGVFADTLTALAHADPAIVGITAAMPGGTGMDVFAKAHPTRMFDVGIAEQHAVTFAAGQAAEGLKPFVAIYSTFLQRAYDQVVHDVCIQNLPVRFAIDRAGLVGADGATHAGAFDTAFLGCLPNMVLMAAADEAELAHMVATAAAYDNGPIAFRYPRGHGYGIQMPAAPTPLPIGKGRIVKQGHDVALLSYGGRLQACLKAAKQLEKQGISATVADARFAKPLDKALIETLARGHKVLLTVEEGAVGGFGSFVLGFMASCGLLDSGACKVRTLHLPDIFQEHDSVTNQYTQAGLDAEHIAQAALNTLNREIAP